MQTSDFAGPPSPLKIFKSREKSSTLKTRLSHSPTVNHGDEEFDSPIAPAYSPQTPGQIQFPKTRSNSQSPHYSGNYNKGSIPVKRVVILILLLVVFTAVIYLYNKQTRRRRTRVVSKETKPITSRGIRVVVNENNNDMYNYKNEPIEADYDPNNRRSRPNAQEQNSDPIEYWISGLFSERILNSSSTCYMPLPSKKDMVKEKGSYIINYNTRASPKIEEKCSGSTNRLWLQQNEARLKVRCESDAHLQTGRDTYPVSNKKLTKDVVHVKYDKDQNNVEYNLDHEVLKLQCMNDVDIRVRVSRNDTRFLEASQQLSNRPHPINILHIVIEGASRPGFMRQMRHLTRVIEDLEYSAQSQHRVFQLLRHMAIHKSVTKSSLGHPSKIVKLAKKHGHVTMYATTQCPRVKSSSSKTITLHNHAHTKHVDHSLSNLFCESKHVSCLAGKNHAQYVSDYTKDFMNKYGGVGRTALVHFNYHEMSTVLDSILASLVKDIAAAHPHTSIIISGGGTGQITGEDYFSSSMGHAESKLPLLIGIMPVHLSIKYPNAWKHLHWNQQMVTSPRDVVNTLRDLIMYSSDEQASPKGVLYRESLKAQRTCSEAGVSDRWCACCHGAFYNSDKELIELSKIAQQSAVKIDQRLSSFRDICEPIQFASLKAFGDTDHVVTWNSHADISYETSIKTGHVRLISTLQSNNPQVRTGVVRLCDKSKIPIKDRELCVCRKLELL